MLRAIIAGETDATILAEMAKGLLRNKIPALREALAGRVSDHHRCMLRELLDDLDHAERKMTTVERRNSIDGCALLKPMSPVCARSLASIA